MCGEEKGIRRERTQEVKTSFRIVYRRKKRERHKREGMKRM